MSHSIIHTVKFHSIPVISFFYLFSPCSFRLLHFILKLHYYYILALESLERREKIAKKKNQGKRKFLVNNFNFSVYIFSIKRVTY
jgi:hypothetical protein